MIVIFYIGLASMFFGPHIASKHFAIDPECGAVKCTAQQVENKGELK